MASWTVTRSDSSKETIDSDRMLTCADGAIEFHNEESDGSKIVKRIPCGEWRHVIKL